MTQEKTVSKKQLAYDGIRAMIVEGEVPQDAPLVERQLCEQLGISRTPVREALRDLAKDGLVELIDGKGVFVKKIGFRDLIELFEVREALEKMAMKLFVERADEESLNLFKSYIEKQEEAYKNDEHSVFMKVDMNIHSLIAEKAQNGRLQQMIGVIYDQIKQIALSARDDKIVRDMGMKSHEEMYAAARAGDTEKAQEAIGAHIVELKNLYMERYYLL